MRDQNIICFSKDWSEDPTSNHHVLTELAKHNNVLWLNSVATRAPDLSSGRDLKKIGRKLREAARGPVRVRDRLWVYTPLVLPAPHSAVARRLNRHILQLGLAAIRRRLDLHPVQLWTFLPTVADYLEGFAASVVVYYCVDEWALFQAVDRKGVTEAEHRLCRRADVVFAVNQALVERKRQLNPNTYLAPHGVDHALFARALDDATAVPTELAELPRPVLGFYGTLQNWVDQDLLAELATRRPDWSIVLIGQELVDTSRLRSHPNIHLLGQRPHDRLPEYCRGFDLGIIPYSIDERMTFVSPVKLREYLSAGLPVISTPVAEVRRYPEYCSVADGVAAFEQAAALALAQDSPALRRQRSDAMRSESWEERIRVVGERVMEAQRRVASGEV
jgi:glycosyltransferase involved in cell wall biosynthesis